MSRDVYADIRNMTAEDRREIFEFAKKRAAEMIVGTSKTRTMERSMRLINFHCYKCGTEAEFLYRSDEFVPDGFYCSCGGKMLRRDFKNNGQRYRYIDRGDGTNLAYEDV